MTDDLIIIDGSQGERAWQILRSSMALSLSMGRSLSTINIRAGRKGRRLWWEVVPIASMSLGIGNLTR